MYSIESILASYNNLFPKIKIKITNLLNSGPFCQYKSFDLARDKDK